MNPIFFKSQNEFRKWLDKNHDSCDEVWIGFYKKGSGHIGITNQEALDEALCYGWIDGIRKTVDEISYMNRYTPRKKRSNWSAININRVNELIELGLMKPAGLKAFEARDKEKSAGYSYEDRPQTLDTVMGQRFRKNKSAWDFFSSQPPGYQRTLIYWVSSAKKEETRIRRLDILIAASEKSKRVE